LFKNSYWHFNPTDDLIPTLTSGTVAKSCRFQIRFFYLINATLKDIFKKKKENRRARVPSAST
jgi:hypothetical protein